MVGQELSEPKTPVEPAASVSGDTSQGISGSEEAGIPASISGGSVQQRMGYSFKVGISETDEERLYRLEKFRRPGTAPDPAETGEPGEGHGS